MKSFIQRTLITAEEKILPIEVKSGKDYQRHNAIRNVMDVPNYEIERGIVFCNDNIHVKGSLTYLPIYMLMFLKNEVSMDNPIYKLDLTGIS